MAQERISPGGTGCGFDEVRRMLNAQPGLHLEEYQRQIDQKLNSYLARNIGKTSRQQRYFPNGPEYIIPVVVHVVHNGEAVGSGTNISYAQVQSQLDALNAGFSNYDGTANYYENAAAAQYAAMPQGAHGVDTRIRFCLATIPSPGASWTSAAEPGVMRYKNTNASRHEYSLPGQTELANITQPGNFFPSTSFLNIWVVTAIRFGGAANSGDCPGIQGYASIAGYNGPEARLIEGVVIRSDVFGDNSVNGNNFPLQPIANPACPGGTSSNFANRGKIAVHEVGHFLGLYHTFEDCINSSSQCSFTGDFICDVNPCDQPNVNVVCGLTDMPENFMYYSDDNILNTFTGDQKARMHAMLNTVRASLAAEANVLAAGVLGADGCFAATVMADFTMPNIFCINTPAGFANINNGSGSNLANQWQWSVSPAANIASPNAASTNITFTGSGTYTVQLTASNSGSQVTTSQQTVNVIACEINSCRKNQVRWKFGWGHLGVNFLNGVPNAEASPAIQMTSDGNQESYITETDPNTGALLFYTNGFHVYNAAGNRINSAPLHPLSGGTGNSNGQIVSVPFPGHPNQYLLIIPNRGWENPPVLNVATNYPPALVFLIDMNGNGSVAPFSCTLDVTAPPGETFDYNLWAYTEDITAVPHANGKDYWIVFSARSTSNRTYLVSFLLNTVGLSQKSVDLMASNSFILPYGCGIVANKDHNRIAFKYTVNNQVYLCAATFDNRMGNFGLTGNYNIEPYNIPYAGGIVFYDNNHIYLSRTTGSQGGLVDMDILTGNAVSFSVGNDFGRLEIGPDGNIYVLERLFFGGPGSITLCRVDRFTGVPTVTTVLTGNQLSPNLVNPIGANFWNLPNSIHCPPAETMLDFTITRTNCNTFRFDITDSINWRDYVATWDFGDGSTPVTANPGQPPLHTYATPGNYTVMLQLQVTLSGCAGIKVIPVGPVKHPVNPVSTIPPIVISGPTNICIGSNLHEVEYEVFYSGTAVYNWTITGGGSILAPGSGTGVNHIKVSFANIAGPRIISVTITDGGCQTNGSINVELHLPGPTNAGIDGAVTICGNQNAPINLFALITGEQNGGVWSRFSGTGGIFNAGAGIFIPDANTGNSVFKYIIAATAGCSEPDTSIAAITINSISQLGDTSLVVCNGKSINLFSVYDTTGLHIISNWSMNGIPVPAPGSISNPGIYQLIIGNGSGCEDTVNATVSIRQPVAAFAHAEDTVAVNGVPFQLYASGGTIYNWTWTPSNAIVSNPTIPDPVVIMTNWEYHFYLDVTDNAGCKGYDTIDIKVYNGPAYYLPTAFTPNGDGVNEYFTPIEAGIVSTTFFRVFNRLGQVIFNATNRHTGWNGTFKGKPQDTGTYTWVIKGVGYNGKIIEKKGTVVLIR